MAVFCMRRKVLKEEASRRTQLIDQSNENFRVARAAYIDQEIYELTWF